MKLIIQIPCFNEAATLPATLADLPRALPGVDRVEWLVVDDGSTDGTADVARAHGVDHIVRFPVNRGLATAFREGLRAALAHGADIVVNTDADNQYRAEGIPLLVAPILEGRADIVIGDRQIWRHAEFGFVKKMLQKLGSWVIGRLAGTPVPDATSGFRALSREAALRLNVLTDYTYTQETIIQAGQHHLGIVSVPIAVNRATRPSRLFRSIPFYIRRSLATMVRIYTLYRALRVFTLLALVPFVLGMALGIRYLVYYFISGSLSGHIQSLIFSAVLLNLSFLLFVLGLLADLIGFNRRLIEEILVHTRREALGRTEAPQPPRGERSCE